MSQGKRYGRPRLKLEAGRFETVYAIGDIHGCLTELQQLETRIVGDAAGASGTCLIVLLGDFIDRGPDSAAVVDHVMLPPPAGFERISLCGNHELAMLRFLADPMAGADWLDLGGLETLRSYGIDLMELRHRFRSTTACLSAAARAVPQHHRRFLLELPILLELGEFVFVHAGLRPGVPLAEQSDHDLIWIREPFLSQGPELERTVIHGHVPTAGIVFGNRRIGVDTGAYATGRLSAVRIRDGVPTAL